MQQAYKPALAATPAQSLLVQTGHTAVLWSPEKLNLSHKQVGIQMVEARHFVMFTDQAFPGRDESETIFTADLSAERGVVAQTKTAYACAVEVLIQHGGRGVIILDSFCDVPPAKVEALENKLKRLGWFDEPLLPSLRGMLNQITPSDEIERTAIDDLSNAIETTINYRMARMDDSMGEAQRSREGGMGRASLTRQERAYYEEIGLELPESITQAPLTQAGPLADGNAVAELLASNNKAMIDVMADAMNNFAATLVAQMKGETTDGQQKSSGSAEETGKEGNAKARRSPLSA